MSERERQRLRRLLDRAVRARLAAQDADERSAVDRRRCADCGMPYDEWTPGCEKCGEYELQLLCRSCHVEKTRRERRERG